MSLQLLNKTFFSTHFRNRKQQRLVFRKQNWRVLLFFVSYKNATPFYRTMTFHFLLKVNVLIICHFFLFFDTCQLLFEFILTKIWATINACLLNNFIDMAIGFSNKTSILMTRCCLHYKFLLSCVESLNQQIFIFMSQTYLTYSLLVVRLRNHGF